MQSDADTLAFNGINGSTGDYLLPAMTAEAVAALAGGQRPDRDQLDELQWRRDQTEPHFRAMPDIDTRDLAQTGWGVVFAHGADPAVREALGELLEHRREQAASRDESLYREFTGPDAYRPGESKNGFLARHGAGPGPVDPRNVPYYLLLVSDPAAIPYTVQHELDVAYAVGRIHFDELDDYRKYARSVVAAERDEPALPQAAVFFGVTNPDDRATEQSTRYLIEPLAEEMARPQTGWDVQTVTGTNATRPRLQALLGGAETPALLFTASHGVGFEREDPRQFSHQGALLCQEWPGRRSWGSKAIPEDFYLAGDHIRDDARLLGLVAFHFACYSAGTPQWDDFAHRRGGRFERDEIAPGAFVAGLPKRLLAHRNGGALAVVGHVERAWGCSFLWEEAGPQLAVFKAMLQQLMAGYPVGAAVEFLNERYAELAV
ncbi:MAG TPA: hypothetical protein VGK54_02315, partial [Chloroflexota bacterium]